VDATRRWQSGNMLRRIDVREIPFAPPKAREVGFYSFEPEPVAGSYDLLEARVRGLSGQAALRPDGDYTSVWIPDLGALPATQGTSCVRHLEHRL